MGYLGEWKNQLCVVEVGNQYYEPVKITMYWPTGIKVKEFLHFYDVRLMGMECRSTGTPGRYKVDFFGRDITIELAHAGDTKAIHVENEPIPKPKVREGTEVRYHNGEWQKYLKTQGWVSARTTKKPTKRCKK